MYVCIESLAPRTTSSARIPELFNTIQQQLDSILWVHNVQLSNPSFVTPAAGEPGRTACPAAVQNAFNDQTAVLLGRRSSLDELPWVSAPGPTGHHRRVAHLPPPAAGRVCPASRGVDRSDRPELRHQQRVPQLDPRVRARIRQSCQLSAAGPMACRSVYLDRRFPWAARTEPDNIGATGPTVTNTAFSLARSDGDIDHNFRRHRPVPQHRGYSRARRSNEFDARPPRSPTSCASRPTAAAGAHNTGLLQRDKGFSAQALDAKLGIRVVNPAPVRRNSGRPNMSPSTTSPIRSPIRRSTPCTI